MEEADVLCQRVGLYDPGVQAANMGRAIGMLGIGMLRTALIRLVMLNTDLV